MIGDAKDYERERSRIDDRQVFERLVQVALGPESSATYTRLPHDMQVHR